MHGSSPEPQPPATMVKLRDTPLPHVCLICADTFPSWELLHEHMQQHDTYHSVRDADMGQPTCAHCKTFFRETWELQRHISRKSCPVFDPSLQPSGARCHDPEMQNALRSGQITVTLQHPQQPEERLRFTLSCCICGLGHSRVADLTRHLQTQHGPFYRAADEYVLLLEEQQPDCVCNPRRPTQPRSHRCAAWRQVAMIEHFINPDHLFLFLPWKLEIEHLATLASVNPRLHAQAPQPIQQLADRQPALLLELQNVCEGLGRHCALCNRSFAEPHELLHHLDHHHKSACLQCCALLKSLAVHFLAHAREPLPCSACSTTQVTYNVTDHTTWCLLQHRCVVLLNMALLYLQTRPDFLSHGRVQTSGSSRRRQTLPAAGDILRYARRRTDTNEAHLLGQEVQDRSPRQDSGQALLDDTDSRSLDPLRTSTTAMSDARHSDTSPRGCPQSGPMHPVSDSRPARSDTSPDPSGTGLEGTDDHHGPSSCGLDASSVGGTDSGIQRILHQALGRDLPQTEPANEDHTGGRHHSLPAMESSAEMPPAGSDSGDCHRRDGAKDSTSPYGIDGTGQLCTQESGQHHGGHSMEDSASYEERPTYVRDALADWLSSVDAGGGPSEGPLTAEISSCARDPGDCIPPPIREPPSLKELLCGALLGAQLQNDSCWCWANAGLLSTLWALLCRQTFSLGDFGTQIRSIRAFLHQLRDTPRQAQCFPVLFQQATQQCVPRDVGEFVSELLLWLETEAISMTWERRYTADSKVVRTEAGSWQFPIALDGLFELDIPSPSLEQLLQPWIHADSMKSAFLSVGTLKCIHVDRVILPANGLGHNHPINLENEVQLPFFEDDHSIDIHWVKHMPVAGIVHLGSM